MRSVYSQPLYHAVRTILLLGALLAWVQPASAQGFGVGGRFAWVTRDDEAAVDRGTLRFVGGQVRLLAGRFGAEVSLDRHTESFELLNQKVTETPIQASLLMGMGRGRVSPFLLGGAGWYRRKVESPDGPESVTT